MRGARPLKAKIAWRGDDAATEMMVPGAVDHHAGRQRILLIGEPRGQRAAASSRGQPRRRCNRRVGRIEDGQEARVHFLALCLHVAVLQRERPRRRRADVDHELRLRQRRRFQRVELGQLLLEVRVALRTVPLETAQRPSIRLFVKGNARLGRVIHHLLERIALGCVHENGLLDFVLERLDTGFDLGFPKRLDDRAHFGADVLGLLLPQRLLLLVLAALRDVLHGEGAIPEGSVGEERLQTVVVLVKDGIVFVIVAARAPEREAKEGGARRVRDVVQRFLPAREQPRSIGLVDPLPVESHGHERFGVPRIQLVAGNLLADEAVVRLVVVERLNDVIAIAPHVGTRGVGFEAVAVRVARDVEPMARPALAVPRRREQPVHHALPRAGRSVVQELLNLGRRRGKPGEVDRDPAEQGGAVGAWVRPETLRFKPGQHERVNRRLHPRLILDGGNGGFRNRLKRPPAALGRGKRRLG